LFGYGAWLIQSLDQNAIAVEVTDLAASDKKNPILVLHVDDDSSLREITKLMLLDFDGSFEIDQASCVDEAFEKMKYRQYDAIVSDYEMPQKNGLEFLKELREQKNNIAFIIFTGRGREEVAVKALNLGADRYIDKNGSPETVYCELANAINKTVERKKSRELLAKSESKYHALVENSLQGISILKAAPLRIVFANGAFGRILGYSSGELMSLSPEGIMSLAYHEDRAVFFKRVENRLRGEPAGSCFEFRAVRKDGSVIWLSALANRVDYDGQPSVQGMFLDISESKKAEEVVKKSEARYRELSNFLPEIVFETDLSGKITFFNERAFEISGFTREELEKGLNMLQFVVPQEREKAKENIKKTLTGKRREAHEYTLYKKDGSTYPAIVKTTAIISDNQVTGLRGIVMDITERKLAEEKVLDSSLYSRSLLEASIDPLVTINSEGKITDVNKATEEATGLSRIELIGSDFSNYFTDPEKARVGYTRVFTEGYVRDYPLAIRNKSGKITDVLYNASIYKNRQGKIQGVFAAARDITQRKRIEEAIIESEYSLKRMHDELKLSEERLRLLFEYAPDACYLNDLRGNFVDGNKAAEIMTGYSRSELIGKSFLALNLLPRNQILKAGKLLALNVIDKPTGPDEFILNRKNGTQVSVEIRTHPLKIQGKKLVLGIARDITERKRAEEALQNGEKRFRQLVLSSPDTIHLLYPNSHKVEFLNRNEFLGYSCAELEGANSILTWLHPDDRDLVQGHYQLVLKGASDGQKPVEYRLKSKAGNWEWVQSRATILKLDEQGKPEQILVTLTIITERKKMEERLKINEKKYDTLVNATNTGYVILDGKGLVLDANLEYVRLTGHKTLDQIKGRSVTEWTAKHDLKRNAEEVKKCCQEGFVRNLEIDYVDENGKITPVEINATVIESEQDSVIVTLCRDITERKKAEEEIKTNQCKMQVMNEKLHVVGSLTRHDVGNKLMVVKSNLYLLKKQIGDNPKLAKYLEDINLAINQSDEMFEFSRFYEKIGIEEPSQTDVAQCFNQAVTLLPNLGTIKIVNDCQGLDVMADSLLKQLFYNFVDNSLKHGEKVTQIRVHFTDEGDGVKLFYEDDGVGIPEANKPKLFHEGFTTGKSTGLGLFFIKKMVEIYGWTITEEGEPGKGARFVINIPKF
jgi:PAS domain S-box-containing protein